MITMNEINMIRCEDCLDAYPDEELRRGADGGLYCETCLEGHMEYPSDYAILVERMKAETSEHPFNHMLIQVENVGVAVKLLEAVRDLVEDYGLDYNDADVDYHVDNYVDYNTHCRLISLTAKGIRVVLGCKE